MARRTPLRRLGVKERQVTRRLVDRERANRGFPFVGGIKKFLIRMNRDERRTACFPRQCRGRKRTIFKVQFTLVNSFACLARIGPQVDAKFFLCLYGHPSEKQGGEQ